MDTLWHVGLANAIVAAGLALLAALVGGTARRPALTHGLWLLVLLKLITPPLWHVSIPQPAASMPEQERIAVVPEKKPAESEAGVDGPSAEPVAETIAPSTEPLLPRNSDTEIQEVQKPITGPAAEEEPIMPEAFSWKAFALAVWLIGSAAWFLLVGYRVWRFRRLLHFAQPAATEVTDQIGRLARGLGLKRPPGAWMVPGAVSPMLWAILGKPRLLLPAALWERLSDDGRAALLVHELAHYRRGDHWVRRLELLATGLYWWNPVVWWARREIGRAEEECCDAWVVWLLPHAAKDYALALIETVDFLSEVRCPLPPAVSGMGHVHFLRRRLAMIMRGTRARRLSGVGFLSLIGLGALVLPLWPSLGQTQPPGGPGEGPPPVRKPREDPNVRKAEDRRPGVGAPRVGDRVGPGAEDRGATGPVGSAGPGRDLFSSGGPPSQRQLTEEIESGRDAVELLAVQLEGKKAELREVETRVGIEKRQLERLSVLSARGAVESSLLEEARGKLELAQIQVDAKRAQYKEAEVRLNQAKRRLAHFQTDGANAGVRGLPTPQQSPQTRFPGGDQPGRTRPDGIPTQPGLPGERGPRSPLGLPPGGVPGQPSIPGGPLTPPARASSFPGGGREGSIPSSDRSDLERRLKDLERRLEQLGNSEGGVRKDEQRLNREQSVAPALQKMESNVRKIEEALLGQARSLTELRKKDNQIDLAKLKELEAQLNKLAFDVGIMRKQIATFTQQVGGTDRPSPVKPTPPAPRR